MRGLEQIAGQRLLFLNWRDQANPEAGGASVGVGWNPGGWRAGRARWNRGGTMTTQERTGL